MAKHSVPNYVALLNEQIAVSQLLSEHHDKADALLDVALEDNFFQKKPIMLHRFFCNVSDIVKKAMKLNDDLLDALLKIMSMIVDNESNPPSNGSIH
jgi:hypothetical protein